MSGLEQARQKMTEAGVAPEAIEVFSHYYGQLESGATGLIPEDSISPLTDPDKLSDVEIDAGSQQAALAKTVIIKLNGGLGTSMGMERAKSLLPVRDGRTFLDLIVSQVLGARESYGVGLPLLFMNSFRTRDDTLAALEQCADLAVEGLPLDFLQNREPKLLTSDLTPVEWPADPSLEWCPPGHGDLYTALLASGVLKTLLDAGYRYASVSNSDNLGAAPNAEIAGWFAASGAPYAAELCRRTKADLKGGHLAVRKSDGRLILRDTAQTPADQMDYFTDPDRHPFFHTNNLWFDLEVLYRTLVERKGVLGLPLIKNVKTVDPTDSSSPEVVQIECAMGAAIEVFDGATAIVVGRERFLPVKTTNDLLLLRSDSYTVGEDGTINKAVDTVPLIDLDSRYYKKIHDFDARFPAGAPSLVAAESLTVKGDWTFGADTRVEGAAELSDDGEPQTIPDGSVIS
ncbi:UTP--glucose-1-phosphate uridylyltransferase [Microlunatus endophyticus]|uniref:UTP--glucose-1-phosphate uridylyltransferase n=1 Tax=Microlunatus endophyticus TaxID=1716077 RepID=A0A917W199_9ACTN|nr:UTP--glucose-1-phosphate uridylyltransferase [Microlunatus endophyticus]GGL56836.1 UTP--glucose-1-phosphate uridylyltransferase [Microlunatus endophyticus]